MPKKTTDPLLGQVLKDAYRLDAKLGEGGMGAVYRGLQLAVDREVAIKVLRPAALKDDDTTQVLTKRFEREARLTSRLQHPNTVKLIDFGRTDVGMYYLVLELLLGRPLSKAMATQGGMEPRRVARIGQQICRSLAEAHAQGIIHRDLKPDNVFLCDIHGTRDFVKVVDFGIARMVVGDDEQTLTSTGLIIGTPKYMAPEQVQALPIVPQTDLYALGIMLYEMLVGEPPYKAESVMALAFKHVNEPLPQLPQSFGGEWQAILTWLLAKDPTERPRTADDLADELERLEQGKPISITGPLPARPESTAELPATIATPAVGATRVPAMSDTAMVPHEGRRSGIWVGLAAGIAVVAAAVAVIVVATAGGGPPPAPSPAAARAAPSDVSSGRPTASDAVVSKEREPSPEPAAKAPEEEPAPVDAAAPTADAAAPTADVAATTVEDATAVKADAVKTAPEKPAVAPPTATAHLKLASEPPGAWVYLGEKLLCKTPCDLRVPPRTGPSELVYKLKGYRDRVEPEVLTGNAVITRTVELKPVASGKRRRPPRRDRGLKLPGAGSKKPGGLTLPGAK